LPLWQIGMGIVVHGCDFKTILFEFASDFYFLIKIVFEKGD
jgi:hypothetical protein